MNRAEIYGFVGWILTFVGYAVFLVWAYVPEATLHRLGITYYPDKYWALALPAFFCTAYALSGVAYVGLNLLSTAPLHSLQTLTDSWARKPVRPAAGEGGPSVPHFADLDVGVVNQLLYCEQRRGQEDSQDRRR